MRFNKNSLNKILKTVIAAAPAIPYVMKRRSTPIAAYIVGGVGFAIAGGLAAVMFFSPRTRNRALVAAKDTYGKVNETISHLRHPEHANGIVSNGIVDRGDYSATTGL